MATGQGESVQEQSVQEQVVQVLLDNIEADTYPSTTMMDIVEESMTPQQASAYAGILLDKVRSDHYPSLDMIRRLQSLGG